MKPSLAVAVAVAALSASPAVVSSQEPIRASLMGSPRVGRPTPPLTLPYVTATPTPAECRGPSAECRVFRLPSELGRVVVLAFGGRPDPALKIDWAALARRADSLGSPRVVLVGVVRAGPVEAQALSASLGGSLKVLVDSGGQMHRQFGVGDRNRDWTIFVVADDGTLVARERQSTLADGGWWTAVAPAIRRGITATIR